jgi:hypothetical protein
MRSSAVLLVAMLAAVPACSQSTIDRARDIVGDVPASGQRLTLVNVPKPSGPAHALFNGRDLSGWSAWLGYQDPSKTYLDDPQASPIGRSRSTAGDFAVRDVDGKPAIWVKGETWGSLVNREDLSNYHLRLEFKWGVRRWAPRQTMPPNNGLLYHTHGRPGTVYGTWQPSVEFEIMNGSTGMGVMVGREVRARTTAALDRSIISPHVRYRHGGKPVEIVSRSLIWNVEGARDAERAIGAWNVLDLYVVGNRAVHVVNGVPVMVLDDLALVGADKVRQPLTHGAIQLQSEGAETWFRNITVEPIGALPDVIETGKR